MITTLITPDQLVDYSAKEAGPIIVALAFVLALGGLTAAAITICGWQEIKSVTVSIVQRRVEILCK